MDALAAFGHQPNSFVPRCVVAHLHLHTETGSSRFGGPAAHLKV
jgi:hypothetical protein